MSQQSHHSSPASSFLICLLQGSLAQGESAISQIFISILHIHCLHQVYSVQSESVISSFHPGILNPHLPQLKMSQLVHNHANRHKNKHKCCNYFTWFIFNLQRRKIWTVLYSNIQCTASTCGVLRMQKILYLGRWWPSVQSVNLIPVRSHVGN